MSSPLEIAAAETGINCLKATAAADPVLSMMVMDQRCTSTPFGNASIDQTLPTTLTLVSTSTTGAKSSSSAMDTEEFSSRSICSCPLHTEGTPLSTLTLEPSEIPLDMFLGFPCRDGPVSYTHLTLPTNREV